MKVIDLLNKIANGEEVPKHIRIRDVDKYTWQEDVKAYWSDSDENDLLSDLDLSYTDLKEDIEIIEDTLEEPKGIPKKIDIIGWDKCIYGVTTKEKELAIEIKKTQKLLNQVLDYLERKGK